LNHAQDRGDGRGLNPSPDEHGPADLSMTEAPAVMPRRLQVRNCFIVLRVAAICEACETPSPSSSAARTCGPAPRATASDGATAAANDAPATPAVLTSRWGSRGPLREPAPSSAPRR